MYRFLPTVLYLMFLFTDRYQVNNINLYAECKLMQFLKYSCILGKIRKYLYDGKPL